MTNKDINHEPGGKKSDSPKPSDFMERIGKQDIPLKKDHSVLDTHPPPDEKPKK